MRVSDTPFIDAAAIDSRVTELAAEITSVLGDSNPLILTVLDGAVPFSRAVRAKFTFPFTSATVRAKSYTGTFSAGEVEVGINFDDPMDGRDLLIVEDIVDTGRTADALTRVLKKENPASIRMVSLLDKPSRRVVRYTPAWKGFTIADHFVIGYGMDYNGEFRGLPDIRILEP